MCLAIPGRVIEIQNCASAPQMVAMDFQGVIRDVSTSFIDAVAVGDCLLVHAGCAIAKLMEWTPVVGEDSAIWEELIKFAASS